MQEKNQEIERLTALLNSLRADRHSIASEPPRFSFDYLYETFNDLKFQQAMEIKKQSQQQIDKLVTELAEMSTNETQHQQIKKLKEQLEIVIEKQQIADNALSQCSELCSYTLDHLHELTQFLTALLQNKEIRESLSEGNILNIQGILDRSMEFTGRQSMANASVANMSAIEFLVNAARQSISGIRDMQTSMRRSHKSIQTTNALSDNKCEEDFSKILNDYEELKRINQVLEDEIVELKSTMKIYEKKSLEINELKAEKEEFHARYEEAQKNIEELKNLQEELLEKYQTKKMSLFEIQEQLKIANEDLSKKSKLIREHMDVFEKTNENLQEMESMNEKLSAELEESQNIVTSLEVAKIKYEAMWIKSDAVAKKLETRLKEIERDLEKNWISKAAHEASVQNLQDEIVNAEAQVAAIRMEMDKIKIDIKQRKMSFSSQHETFKENKENVIATRHKIEISDDRKILLMGNSEVSEDVRKCNECQLQKNKIAELKKHLQAAVDMIKKEAEKKAKTERSIKDQLNKTENVMQQVRVNMETILKSKNNQEN